jgi:hypothetical protein
MQKMAKVLSEGFAIFAKYEDGKPINATQDEDGGGLFGGPDLDEVSQEDKNRLIALGWVPDPYENWYIDLSYLEQELKADG